jgi:hypothetical protein
MCAGAHVGLTRLRVDLEALVDVDGVPTPLTQRGANRQFRA